MMDGKQAVGGKMTSGAAPQKRNMRKLALFAVLPVLLAAADATYFLVPANADTAAHPAAQAQEKAAPQAAQPHPKILDVPEIVVTLPNGGRARQLRIKISL